MSFDPTTDIRALANAIARAIASCVVRPSSELDLAHWTEQQLLALDLMFVREHRFDRRDRVDFFVDGRLAVELKTQGSVNDLARQVQRYARQSGVGGVLVVTTRGQHRVLPDTFEGKPIVVCHLIGASL